MFSYVSIANNFVIISICFGLVSKFPFAVIIKMIPRKKMIEPVTV